MLIVLNYKLSLNLTEYGKVEFLFTKSFRWFPNIANNTLPQIEIKKNGNELYNFKNTAPNIFLFTK